MSPACAINDAPGKFPDVPGRPQAKPSGDHIPLGGFVFRGANKHGSEAMVSPESDHRDAVSPPERDEKAPTTRRAEKLKAACLLAGVAIVVLTATAGWVYFLVRLLVSLANWIFG